MNQTVNVIDLGMVNAFMIKGEHLILVDTGYDNHYDKVLTYLESHHIDPQKIKLIVITHNHSDHVSNLVRLHGLTGADVVAHEEAAGEMEAGIGSPVVPNTLLSKFMFNVLGFMLPENQIRFKPNKVFSDEFDLEQYGVEGKLLHTPGHTDSSISVVLDNGDAIVGDMIIGKRKGKGVVAKMHSIAQNPCVRLNSLSRLLDTGAKVFYTSHGEKCTSEAVKNLIEEA